MLDMRRGEGDKTISLEKIENARDANSFWAVGDGHGRLALIGPVYNSNVQPGFAEVTSVERDDRARLR